MHPPTYPDDSFDGAAAGARTHARTHTLSTNLEAASEHGSGGGVPDQEGKPSRRAKQASQAAGNEHKENEDVWAAEAASTLRSKAQVGRHEQQQETTGGGLYKRPESLLQTQPRRRPRRRVCSSAFTQRRTT